MCVSACFLRLTARIKTPESAGSHGIKLWSSKPGCRPPASGAGLYSGQQRPCLLSQPLTFHSLTIPFVLSVGQAPRVPAFGRLRQENWSSRPAWEDSTSKQTAFYFKHQTTPPHFIMRISFIFTRVITFVFLLCVSCLCFQPIVPLMCHIPMTFPT